MLENGIILKEQYGSVGDTVYLAKGDRNSIVEIKSRKIFSIFTDFFTEVLLPYGYPDSVSEDYCNYQIWDTLQAFCSTITSAFTTRAILKGVGVGDSEASAISATITWIMKDGTGLWGRIIFAWWKGNCLDSECKQWRLFADVLNDFAMLIELFLPFVRGYSLQVLCLTTGMKAIVGIAGGATRATITHHQAIKDNSAEISAKDGSQETVVNLIASFSSIFLLNFFGESIYGWIFVSFLMIFHIFANYMAVSSLIFRNFNNQRLAIVLKTYFNIGTVLNPQKVNGKEALIIGFQQKVKHLCGFDIKLGEPIKNHLKISNPANIKQNLSYYTNRNYFLVPDLKNSTIFVSFEKNESPQDVLEAYFHATCLSVAICIYNGLELDIFSKRQRNQATPITRLMTFIKRFERGNQSDLQMLPHNILSAFHEYFDQEVSMFFTALQVNGWKVNSHALKIGEWRTEWKDYMKKFL